MMFGTCPFAAFTRNTLTRRTRNPKFEVETATNRLTLFEWDVLLFKKEGFRTKILFFNRWLREHWTKARSVRVETMPNATRLRYWRCVYKISLREERRDARCARFDIPKTADRLSGARVLLRPSVSFADSFLRNPKPSVVHFTIYYYTALKRASYWTVSKRVHLILYSNRAFFVLGILHNWLFCFLFFFYQFELQQGENRIFVRQR